MSCDPMDDLLFDMASAKVDELIRERDQARREAADLRAALAEEQKRPDFEWSHEVLHDLVDLRNEEAVLGRYPRFKEREAKAWANAREIFEP